MSTFPTARIKGYSAMQRTALQANYLFLLEFVRPLTPGLALSEPGVNSLGALLRCKWAWFSGDADGTWMSLWVLGSEARPGTRTPKPAWGCKSP